MNFSKRIIAKPQIKRKRTKITDGIRQYNVWPSGLDEWIRQAHGLFSYVEEEVIEEDAPTKKIPNTKKSKRRKSGNRAGWTRNRMRHLFPWSTGFGRIISQQLRGQEHFFLLLGIAGTRRRRRENERNAAYGSSNSSSRRSSSSYQTHYGFMAHKFLFPNCSTNVHIVQ